MYRLQIHKSVSCIQYTRAETDNYMHIYIYTDKDSESLLNKENPLSQEN